jgi:hypothetical protein
MKFKYKFKLKLFDKIADQLRLLSWAQGAIYHQLTHSLTYGIIILILIFWIFLQFLAVFVEGLNHDE